MGNKKQELEKPAPAGALARPSFIPQSHEGTEHIESRDLNVPRLQIAQAQSPQLDPTNASKFIDGLKQGEVFNTLTKEIYGNTLSFIVIRGERPFGIEFFPREEGGGIKDARVEMDDARMQFRQMPNGDRKNPIATQFRNFIVLLTPFEMGSPMQNVIALSCKGSNLNAAKDLNSLIKYRNAPIWAGKYKIETVPVKGQKGNYFAYRVSNDGWIETEEQMGAVKNLFDALKDKKFVVDVDETHDDETDTGVAPDAPDAEREPSGSM